MLPPPIIQSSRLICFARIPRDAIFRKMELYIGSGSDFAQIGRVPNIAVARMCGDSAEGVAQLLFCDDLWDVRGVISFADIDSAKLRAEDAYPGIDSLWVNSTYSKEDEDSFLKASYGVDPDTRWWELSCSFCGRVAENEEAFFAGNCSGVFICTKCIERASAIVNIRSQGVDE